MTCKCGCGKPAQGFSDTCWWGKPNTPSEKSLVAEAQDRALFNLIAYGV